MIAYELLMKQTLNKMVTDKTVLFHWDLIMHDFDTPVYNPVNGEMFKVK